MTALVVILFLIVLAVNLVLAVFVLRALSGDDSGNDDALRYEGKLDAALEQVRAQLESVHKGLGEMQVLAGDVDSLERTLSGVKTRGIWGEVQLRSILDDIVPGRYDEQVPVKKGSERGGVDFAVRLPRKHGDGEEVVLPIDAKFPLTRYEQIVAAGDANDQDALKDAQKSLEQEVKRAAKSIKEKYIVPPRTTDFALMYVPTEGLFAELARTPGLLDELRREYRVVLSGPVNLSAILGTIELGYQLVKIENDSRHVWDTLVSVRREFEKFGEGLEGVNKSLQAANNKMEQMEVRHRQMSRALEGADKLEDN